MISILHSTWSRRAVSKADDRTFFDFVLVHIQKSSEEATDLRREVDSRQRQVEEMQAKLSSSRHRNKEMECALAKCESLAEDVSRRLQMEREETSRQQMQIDLLSEDREKMQVRLVLVPQTEERFINPFLQ